MRTGEAAEVRHRRDSRWNPLMAGAARPHSLDPQFLTSSRPAAPAIIKSSDDLVEAHLRFVSGIAREYRNMGLPLEDLVNEGNVGLIEAARRFDPARGTQFTTYAVWWIRKSIRRALTRYSANVYVPEYQMRMLRRLRNTSSRLSSALGREAKREEVSKELGVGIAKIDRMLQMKLKEISIDAGIGPGRDTTLLHLLVDRSCLHPEDHLIRRENREMLRRALLHLTDPERTVIVNRFGLGGGASFSLSEIGRCLGVSRERVRQIEDQSKKRLRRFLKRQDRPSRNARPSPAVSARITDRTASCATPSCTT